MKKNFAIMLAALVTFAFLASCAPPPPPHRLPLPHPHVPRPHLPVPRLPLPPLPLF